MYYLFVKSIQTPYFQNVNHLLKHFRSGLQHKFMLSANEAAVMVPSTPKIMNETNTLFITSNVISSLFFRIDSNLDICLHQFKEDSFFLDVALRLSVVWLLSLYETCEIEKRCTNRNVTKRGVAIHNFPRNHFHHTLTEWDEHRVSTAARPRSKCVTYEKYFDCTSKFKRSNKSKGQLGMARNGSEFIVECNGIAR